ncbi:hypothetical protein F5B17DRAFT_150553 [Nemania serpens]|nr:hypothetical protein F5B17DRAFT_150553 [Nemania serpens]
MMLWPPRACHQCAFRSRVYAGFVSLLKTVVQGSMEDNAEGLLLCCCCLACRSCVCLWSSWVRVDDGAVIGDRRCCAKRDVLRWGRTRVQHDTGVSYERTTRCSLLSAVYILDNLRTQPSGISPRTRRLWLLDWGERIRLGVQPLVSFHRIRELDNGQRRRVKHKAKTNPSCACLLCLNEFPAV